MGFVTFIAWCHHTFNPWIGCWKISEGCAHCYAAVDTFARASRAKGRELWGKDADRHTTSDENWRKPLAWDRAAKAAGERRRVFCGSLCDVFEDRADLAAVRARLFDLILATPNLDWLLLTKRPGSINHLLGQTLRRAMTLGPAGPGATSLYNWLKGEPPANVWLGTTVENQARADERIPALLEIPAKVRFLSMEPLLGPVDLVSRQYAWPRPGVLGHSVKGVGFDAMFGTPPDRRVPPTVDWVIVGGESGPNARPFDLEWGRSLVNQCRAAGVSVFVKQMGSRPVRTTMTGWGERPEAAPRLTEDDPFRLSDPKGGDPDEWPEDLRVREFPEVTR